MGDGNSYCMMLYKPNISGRCNAVTDCDWEKADEDTINLLQNKYGFNMAEWYKAAYFCAKDGDGQAQTASLPTDMTQPLCFWNTPARKLTLGTSCATPRCETFSKDWEVCCAPLPHRQPSIFAEIDLCCSFPTLSRSKSAGTLA